MSTRIKDERWTIRDKLAQYRGVAKLQVRDKELRIASAASLRKKVSRELRSLKNEVHEYRQIAQEVLFGDKRRLRLILQQHKRLHLAHYKSPSEEIHDSTFQDLQRRRKQLDKLRYERAQKEKKFLGLKMEHLELEEKARVNLRATSACDYQQQKLVSLQQHWIAQGNAAKFIQDTYRTILDVLRKDSLHWDVSLEAVRGDQGEQAKVMYRVVVMGRVASEGANDNRKRCKVLARRIFIEGKERERDLEVTRAKVKDLWAYAQSLVRIEPDTWQPIARANSQENMERQIGHLEEIFEKAKDSLRVRSYEQLYSRINAQIKQKERLTKLLERSRTERDTLLEKTRHAETILASISHSVVATTGHYKTEKKELREDMESQREREIELKKQLKHQAELQVKIRMALENMHCMLTCVKGPKAKTPKKGSKQETTKANLNESSSLSLLSLVSRKIGVLCAMSNVQLEEKTAEEARALYQNYVANYMSGLFFQEQQPKGFSLEPEIPDPSVPTRTSIKLNSRKIVEARTQN